MLYFNDDEEQAERVEDTYEELHRKPAPPIPTPRVVVASGPTVPKPKLTLVPKSK